MKGIDMDRKQREKQTLDASRRVLDLAKWPDSEQRVYTYLFASFGLQMLRAGENNLEQVLREKLTEGGVEVTTAHSTGDSSYPTEYTIKFGDVQARAHTIIRALVWFRLARRIT